MDNTLLDTMETLFEPVPTDDVAEEPIYEAKMLDKKVLVPKNIWDSWTGRRYKNGSEYHGPVHILGSGKLYTGSRFCGCVTCQADVAPRHRKN